MLRSGLCWLLLLQGACTEVEGAGTGCEATVAFCSDCIRACIMHASISPCTFSFKYSDDSSRNSRAFVLKYVAIRSSFGGGGGAGAGVGVGALMIRLFCFRIVSI